MGHGVWAELAGAPDICEVVIEQVGIDATLRSIRQNLEQGYALDLREERGRRSTRRGLAHEDERVSPLETQDPLRDGA